MNEEKTIFQVPLKRPVAFNSTPELADTATILTADKFDESCERIDQLIDHSRRILFSEENC